MANLSNINNKFLVTTTGEVLVGRTAATGTSKLQVSGSLLIGTDINSGIPLVVQETTADGFAIGFMRNTNATNGNGLVIDVNSTGGAYIQDWRQASTVKMRLLQNGNLGIGTPGPSVKLDVVGSGKFQPGIADGDALVTIAQTNSNAYVHAGIKINAGNTNPFYIYQSGSSNTLRFNYNSLADAGGQLVITDSGNVGIGTASPDTQLHVYNSDTNWGAYSIITLGTDVEGTNEAELKYYRGAATATESFQLAVRGTTALTALYNGNVGIGTTTPDAILNISKTSFSTTFTSADSYIRIGKTENATNGYQFIGFGYNNGSADLVPAYIGYQQTGTPGNYTKGDLVFGTRNVTTNTAPTERMRIDSAGNVGIGTVSPDYILTTQGSGVQRLKVVATDPSQHSAGVYFVVKNGASQVGTGTIATQNNGDMDFYTGSTSESFKMTIEAGGNVGIGTNSPDTKLEVDGKSSYPIIKISASSNTSRSMSLGMTDAVTHFIDAEGSGSNLIFKTVGIERMRILSDGSQTQIKGKHGGGADLLLYNTDVTLSTNQMIGRLGFYKTDGSGSNVGVSSSIQVRATNSGAGSFMAFHTDGETPATQEAERMRITSGGTIEVRNGSTVGGELKMTGTDNDFTLNGQRGQVIIQIAGVNKYVMDAQQFYPTDDNARNLGTASSRYSVVYSANGVNTSDRTLKKNIKECDLGIDFIDSLKPKSYNFKDLKKDNDAYGKQRYGLIAQDLLQTELKDSVFGKKDGEYGLSYNDLIAPMIKAIQELKAEIELLKSK